MILNQINWTAVVGSRPTRTRNGASLGVPSTKSSGISTTGAGVSVTHRRHGSWGIRRDERYQRMIQMSSGISVNALRNIDWPEALLFDCDGVLVDTEAEGHRIAFNEAFERKGLPHAWDLEQYGHLLEIGGGKERMNAYFTEHENTEPWASVQDPEERKAFLKQLHELKTDIFNELIETGKLPVRPGVVRLIHEAMENGVKVAVCSTSNERAVSNIVKVLLGDTIAQHMRVFAGDVVPKKKPAPDVYLLAAKELDVDPARCVVIEDSKIGVAAGKAAGMRVVVTESYYTKGEDFSDADAVFDCIGEEGEENFSLHDLTTPGSFWLNPPARVEA